MVRPALALILMAGVSPAALAADVEAPSAIRSVTVYPDGATVTRSADIALPAGSSTVTLRGISSSIDVNSIRVTGEANAALSIGAVDVKIVPGNPRPMLDPAVEQKLDELRTQRETLAGQIEAAEVKKAAIQRYAQASPEKMGPDSKPLDVGQWSAAWDAVGDGLAKVNDSLRQLKTSLKRVDGEIIALERGSARPPNPGQPRRDLVIALDAAGAATGTLTVTYRVVGASWTPVYDARLDTGGKGRKPSVELVRRAQIVQRTGEDWRDVALSVSTVRASRGTSAPDIQPLLVNFYEAVVGEGRERMIKSAAPRAAGNVADMAAAPPPPATAQAAAEPVVAREQFAQLESGAYQASFRVAGPVSVPTDGTPKVLTLGSRASEPTLGVKVVPALDETAYLDASFTNDEDAPILPGEVLLHRDGTYVGKGRLGLIGPGDKVEFGFGADDKVKVTRVPVRRKENEPSWIGSTKTEQREFKTTVKNLHDSAVRIAVLDQVPVSENSAIVVEGVGGTPPTDKTVSDKRGVMGWTWDYQPGESKEIRLSWRMKWPADKDIMFQGQGGGVLRR